tara:strand:+ start:104886 stop:105767 length:882 start_codon:yes stop_codon:yes gene_type:complete
MAADPSSISERARAKINLTLHVTGRRDDGYHLLESVVVFADVGDEIAVTPSLDGTLTLDYDGPFADLLPTPADNLILRAAAALKQTFSIGTGAHIRLTKILPVASGIGGGSADAAATLRALAQLWNIDINAPACRRIAQSLGADVPVCLAAHPAMMTGTGETLASIPTLPDTAMVLVNPGVEVSTPAVFKARSAPFSTTAGWPQETADIEALVDAIRARHNDLQAPAIGLAPEIGVVLEVLGRAPGARLARMSGSGATCFALCASLADAEACASAVRQAYPTWWVTAAGLQTT